LASSRGQEKSLKLTLKIRYTENIFEIGHENLVFLRKQPLLKILAMPLLEDNKTCLETD
jgi:hypothetical protein